MRARVDATHSIITSRQRVEATMTAEISTMRHRGVSAPCGTVAEFKDLIDSVPLKEPLF